MKIDHNSNTNQSIKAKLIEREVICSVNQTIQAMSQLMHEADNEILRDHYDDLTELLYQYDYESAALDVGWREWGDVDKSEFEQHEFDTEDNPAFGYFNIEDGSFTDADDWAELCDDQGIETEPVEIFEFWHVTGWYADKLREQGQTVVDILDFTVWGRRTTGQAISLDHCTGVIAENMEILEGQKNEWSV